MSSHSTKLLVAAVTSLALSVTFNPAYADETSLDSTQPLSCATLGLNDCLEIVDYNPEPIVVNGKVFTVQDGLERHRVSGYFSHVISQPQLQGWMPYYDTYVNWGISWVRNQEIGYLHYRGTTQAGGNVYNGKRIIQTSLTYKRDTNVQTAVSNAVFKNNTWKPGEVGTVWMTDTPNPSAPKTQFTYDYYSVDPGLVG